MTIIYSVDSLKRQRKYKKNQYSIYKRRYQSICRIISNIDNQLDDDVNRINNHMYSCLNSLESGIKGRTISNVYHDLEECKERYVYGDNTLSNCRANVMNEKNRCFKNMNDLEYDIRCLENSIRNLGGTIYPWE